MVTINEKELQNKTEAFFKRKGLRVVLENKKGRIRPDMIVYKIDKNGESVPEVVIEVKLKPTPLAQQHLMKYVNDFNAPYALLVTIGKHYWFDGKTFLPIEEPEFKVEQNFLLDNVSISQILWKVMDNLRGSFSHKQIGLTITQVLLVRAYLDEKKDLDKWWEINTKEELSRLIEEAIQYYSIDIKPSEYGITDDFVEIYINEFGAFPPRSSILPNIIYKTIQNEYKENLTTEPVQNIFGGITQQLNFDKEKVIDLTAGLGLTAFEVMQDNKLNHLTGFEINSDTTSLFKILSIIGGYSVDAVCADSLKSHDLLKDDKYSLTLVSPPFGYRYKISDEQVGTFRLAGNRKQADAADLFIEKSVRVTRSGGYIVALVPESLLFSTKSKATRDFIKDETIIESIISLPSHTLSPFTMVKVSLLVLRKKKDNDETAKELFISSTESIDDIDKIIKGFSKWKKGDGSLA